MDEAEKAFVKGAVERGLTGLKGHRSVGGTYCRWSNCFLRFWRNTQASEHQIIMLSPKLASKNSLHIWRSLRQHRVQEFGVLGFQHCHMAGKAWEYLFNRMENFMLFVLCIRTWDSTYGCNDGKESYNSHEIARLNLWWKDVERKTGSISSIWQGPLSPTFSHFPLPVRSSTSSGVPVDHDPHPITPHPQSTLILAIPHPQLRYQILSIINTGFGWILADLRPMEKWWCQSWTK